jgi:hypothetical protein
MYDWPNDADGNVFRSLESQGFDFSKKYIIDFNIDLGDVLRSEEALEVLRTKYPSAEIYDHSDDDPPYLQLQITSKLSYPFVMKIQSDLTNVMRPFNAWCDSWGVLH